MSDDELIDILTGVMREAFRKPSLAFQGDIELRALFGIDSVQFVTLILSIEERFSVLLPEDRVDQLTTVQSLLDLVKWSLAQDAEPAP